MDIDATESDRRTRNVRPNDVPGGTHSVSRRVVDAVADEREVHPTELEPLYHSIDPDSLDGLFSNESRAANQTVDSISFTFARCRIVVSRNDTSGEPAVSVEWTDVSPDGREGAPNGEPESPD